MAAKLSPKANIRARKLSLSLPHQHHNIGDVIFTDIRVYPTCPSYYPTDLVGKSFQRLFVCKWCFTYTTDINPFNDHTTISCPIRKSGPIGSLLYRKGDISIFRVDGLENKRFAQNLSLFAKLFLETKSVFYHVTTFVFYTLIYNDAKTGGPRVVGFFSKEKLSWDNNNLACICIFPPWQKRGFGQLLMAMSYELSKWENKLGGPEKPLSDMGGKAYKSYWSATIARFVMHFDTSNITTTINNITQATYIFPDEVRAALKEMGLIVKKTRANTKLKISKAIVSRWMLNHKVGLDYPVDRLAFMDKVPFGIDDDAMDTT